MSRSTTELFAKLLAALILSSCRFGGPTGDPTLPVFDGAGGSAESGGRGGSAGGSGQAGSAASGGISGGAGGTTGGTAGASGAAGGTSGAAGGGNSGGSAGATTDASRDVSDDIAEDGSVGAPDGSLDGDDGLLDTRTDVSSDGESGDSGPPTACLPPFTSAVCDPVCNTGCTPLLRCDITETPRTGVCVGTLLSTVTEGMPCTRSIATDDCAERLSCVERICRRLCYRDTDCTTSGTCCTVPIDFDGGSSGYRMCGPCNP